MGRPPGGPARVAGFRPGGSGGRLGRPASAKMVVRECISPQLGASVCIAVEVCGVQFARTGRVAALGVQRFAVAHRFA